MSSIDPSALFEVITDGFGTFIMDDSVRGVMKPQSLADYQGLNAGLIDG
jgi:hypothetical protein